MAGKYDGSLVYDTKIDSDGFKNGLNGLKTLAKSSAIAIGAVGTAAAGAFAAISTGAVKSYADFEQLTGGVETLFKSSADTVKKYAQEAYKTSGLSANEYMETVTSFSASLIQSVGGDTKKAADMADMALRDMSDNANKMGSDMNMIMNTYQSLSRGNFAMLDNLKLGYGGTRAEMQRLIKDAAKLDKTIKANDMSFGNIVKSIHAVQTEMGITGTTAKEAATTISGSINMTKSAWKNLLTGIADSNADISKLTNELADSVVTVFDNLEPVIEQTLENLPNVITKLGTDIIQKIPEIFEGVLPSVVDGGLALVEALLDVLSTNAETIGLEAGKIVSMIVEKVIELAPEMWKAGKEIVSGLITGITAEMPVLSTAVASIGSVIAASKIIPMIGSLIDGFQKLSITMAANPATLMIGGFVGLAAAVVTATIAYNNYVVQHSEVVIATKAMAEASREAVTETENLSNSLSSLNEKATTTIENANAEAYAERLLADELYNLAGQEDLTAAQKERMRVIVDQLNQSIDGLNLELDDETGKLSLTREEVQKLITQKLELAKANAMQDLYTEKLKAQYAAEVEAEKNARNLAEARKQLDEIVKRSTNEYTGLMAPTREDAKAIGQLEEAIKNYETALSGSKEALQTATDDMQILAGVAGVELPDSFGEISATFGKTAEDIEQRASDMSARFKEEMQTVAGEAETQKDIAADYYEEAVVLLEDYAEKYAAGVDGYTADGLKKVAQHAIDMKAECEKIGINVNDGIIAGLNSRVEAVREKIKSIADMIPDSLKKLLGINSPAKKTIPIGEAVVEGMVVGVNKKANLLKNASKDLTTDALKAVQETQDSHSAAKETIKLGEDFADGFTVGIKNGTEKAVDAADNMVLDALDSLNNLSSERAMEKLRAEGKLVGKGDIDKYIATHPEALYDETLFGLPGIKSSRGLNMMDIKNGYWADITAEQLSITQEMYDTVVAWLKEFPEAIGKEVSFRYTNNRQTGEREVLDALVGNNGFIVQIMNDALASSRLIEVPSPVYMQGAFPELRKLYEYMARSEMFFSGDYVTHLEDVLPDNAANIQVTYFTEGSKRNTAALFNPIQWLDGTVFDAAWKENSRSTDKGELQRQQDDAQAAELRSLKHHLAMEEITQKEYYDALKAFRDKYYSVGTAEYERYTEELFQMDKDFLRESQDLELRNLNHSLNMGNISEKEYYSALEKFRDKYFVKDSAEWQQYTEEIHQFRLRENEEFEGNILKGLQHMRSMGKLTEEEYYAALTKYRDKYIERGTDQWQQYTEEIYNHYKQVFENVKADMDEILTGYQQQYTGINNRLNEAMNKSVTKITIKSGKYGVEEYYKLADNSKYIKQLDEYTKLLTDIREKRGDLPSEVQNTLKSLDVENGIIFAKEILNATDKEWDTYIKSFGEVAEKSARIASDLTQDDLETAMKLLGEKYKEIPEQFFSIGNSSAENFASAFLLSIDPLALMIKKKISDSMLASVVYGPGIGADGRGFNSGSTFNNSYNFYSSADTTTQQLNAAADKAVMDRLRGGGGN